MEAAVCPSCSRAAPPGSAFCGNCGARLLTAIPASPFRPGWYPDQSDPSRLRYHNGNEWTGHLSRAGHQWHEGTAEPAMLADDRRVFSQDSVARGSSLKAGSEVGQQGGPLGGVLALVGAALMAMSVWLAVLSVTSEFDGTEEGLTFWELREAEGAIGSLHLWALGAAALGFAAGFVLIAAHRRPSRGVGLLGGGLAAAGALVSAYIVIQVFREKSRFETEFGIELNLEFGVFLVIISAIVLSLSALVGLTTAAPLSSGGGVGSARFADKRIASRSWAWVLFSPEGRIGRKTYWLYGYLPLTLGFIIAVVLYGPADAGAVVGLIIYLGLIYPSIAVSIKRWHDRDKSGWWVLIGLIPLIGAVWAFIENGFLAGTPGPNRYGAGPEGPGA
jgi:uncharacterized membrane protein YhaH (DUF805 family)